LLNGADNFRSHLIDTSKLKASAPTSHHNIDKLIDELDENQLSDRLNCCSRHNVDAPSSPALMMRLGFS
jgi:hypothetical protein